MDVNAGTIVGLSLLAILITYGAWRGWWKGLVSGKPEAPADPKKLSDIGFIQVGYSIAPMNTDQFKPQNVKVPDGWTEYDVRINSVEMQNDVNHRLASGGAVHYHYETVPEKFINGVVTLNDTQKSDVSLGLRAYEGTAYMKKGSRVSLRLVTSDSQYPVRMTIYKPNEPQGSRIIASQDFMTTGNVSIEGVV